MPATFGSNFGSNFNIEIPPPISRHGKQSFYHERLKRYVDIKDTAKLLVEIPSALAEQSKLIVFIPSKVEVYGKIVIIQHTLIRQKVEFVTSVLSSISLKSNLLTGVLSNISLKSNLLTSVLSEFSLVARILIESRANIAEITYIKNTPLYYLPSTVAPVIEMISITEVIERIHFKPIMKAVALAGLVGEIESKDAIVDKLRSKSTVNHMQTKTTQETMRIQEEAQNKLSRIAKKIERMIENNETLEEIKYKFKEEIRAIIATAIRDVYFLGFHFIEEFAGKLLELKTEQIQAMNDMIEKAISELWMGVQKFMNRQLSEIGKPPKGLEIKLLMAEDAQLFDIASIFAFITNIFTQKALNESTLTTVLTLQVQNEEQIPMMWISERDERVCPRCQNLDGQSKRLGELFHDDIGGIDVENPPLHPYCRCRLLPMDGELVFNA